MEWSDDHFADVILEHNIGVWNEQILEEWSKQNPPSSNAYAKICIWDSVEKRYTPLRIPTNLPMNNCQVVRQNNEIIYRPIPPQQQQQRPPTPYPIQQQTCPVPQIPQIPWLPWNPCYKIPRKKNS